MLIKPNLEAWRGWVRIRFADDTGELCGYLEQGVCGLHFGLTDVSFDASNWKTDETLINIISEINCN